MTPLKHFTDVIIYQRACQSPHNRKRTVSALPPWVVFALCVTPNKVLILIRRDYYDVGRSRAFIGLGYRPADVNLVPAVLTHIRLIETLFNPGPALLVKVVLLLSYTGRPGQIGFLEAEQIPAPFERIYEFWIRAVILPLVKLTAYRMCLTDRLSKHDERGQVIGRYELQRILINGHFDVRPLSGSAVLEIKTYLPALTIRKQEAVGQSPQLLVRIFYKYTQLPERLLFSLLLCNFMMADREVASRQNRYDRTNSLNPVCSLFSPQDEEQQADSERTKYTQEDDGSPSKSRHIPVKHLAKHHVLLAQAKASRMPAPCHHVQQVAA